MNTIGSTELKYMRLGRTKAFVRRTTFRTTFRTASDKSGQKSNFVSGGNIRLIERRTKTNKYEHLKLTLRTTTFSLWKREKDVRARIIKGIIKWLIHTKYTPDFRKFPRACVISFPPPLETLTCLVREKKRVSNMAGSQITVPFEADQAVRHGFDLFLANLEIGLLDRRLITTHKASQQINGGKLK